MRIQNRIQICMDELLLAKVDRIAKRKGLSRSLVIRLLLKRGMKKQSKED